MKRIFGIIAVIMLAAAPWVAAGGVDVGEKAPNFTTVDQDGNKVTLSKIDGVRVLEWVNPGCPFVQRHYKEGTMKNLVEEYGSKGVTWLAVNSNNFDDQAASKNFHDANGLPYPILVDQDGSVGRLYGAQTTPHMFIIDAKGVIVYEGGIDDDPRGTKENDSTNYVDAALEEVLAGRTVTTAESKPYGCSVKYKE